MTQINKPFIPFWAAAAFLCMLLFFAAFFTGCNHAKKVVKEQQYINKIQADYDSIKAAIAAKVIAEYVEAHPCDLLPVIDVDSFSHTWGFIKPEECPFSNNVENDYIDLTIKRDTIRVPVPFPFIDKRKEQLLKDSINAKNILIASLQAQLAEKQNSEDKRVGDAKEAGKEEKKAKKYLFWWLVGSAVLNIILIAFSLRKAF